MRTIGAMGLDSTLHNLNEHILTTNTPELVATSGLMAPVLN